MKATTKGMARSTMYSILILSDDILTTATTLSISTTTQTNMALGLSDIQIEMSKIGDDNDASNHRQSDNGAMLLGDIECDNYW